MGLVKRRLLVVDDDPSRRLLVSSLLSQAGYSVEAVADGAMALTIIHSRATDLALVAADLAQPNGYTLCKAIKQDSATERIPVIMVTAIMDEASRHLSREAGADELVSVPLHRESFLDLVQELLH